MSRWEHLPEGWLTDEEADELARLAAGKTVLELGSYKGRSTVCFASVAKYVVSVDTHGGTHPQHPGDTLPEYVQNVRHLANVALVVGDWRAIAPYLGDFDLVYVDGSHGPTPAEEDTRIALARNPETIVIHDWADACVREGARYALGDIDPAAVVGSVASFRIP